MKILIFIILGMVNCTVCCDCQLQNWSWKQCGYEGVGSSKLDITVYITDNCEGVRLNGTCQNKLGKIHSVQVEAEGTINGMPVISFSDPNGCTVKDNPQVEHGIPIMRDTLLHLFCNMQTEKFDIVIPYNELEKSALQSVTGDFKFTLWNKNINNVARHSDCYECSGTLQCSEEDY